MSDFDFDELDKAVTGALGTTPSLGSEDAAKEAPERREVTPAPNMPTTTGSDESVKPERPPTPPALRRSSGRFMDVVHPSSDMRTTRADAKTAEAVPAQNRSTPGFTPPKAAAMPEFEPEVKESQAEEKPLEAPAISLGDTSPVGEWSKPLESPFLPGAKVEKRPLGGAMDTDSFAAMLEETGKETLLEAPDEPRLEAHTMPDPIDFAAQSMTLPFENEDTGEVKGTEETPQEQAVIEEAPAEIEATPLLETVTEDKPADEPVEPIGPTSISQQYTEQVSAEQPTGAIYDTENYHQPLVHNEKKHSSVWTILGILLLIVLGAGAGVAFYFFVLN